MKGSSPSAGGSGSALSKCSGPVERQTFTFGFTVIRSDFHAAIMLILCGHSGLKKMFDHDQVK